MEPLDRILSLFVFNPTLSGGREEKEYDNVLYYHPSSHSRDTQCSQVGLCEALVNFSRTFSPDRPCELMRTDKKKIVYFEAEPEVWWAASVEQPHTDELVPAKKKEAVPPGYDAGVPDDSLQHFIRAAYQSFRFFHAPITDILASAGPEAVRRKLLLFLSNWVALARCKESPLLHALDGFKYFPLDKLTFLNIQSFQFLSSQRFPDVKHMTSTFNNYWVSTTLSRQADASLLYAYITQYLTPALQREGKHEEAAQHGCNLFGNAVFKFVLPLVCSTQQAAAAIPYIPVVRLGNGQEAYHLIVFHHNKSLWLLMVDDHCALSTEYLLSLSAHLVERVKVYDSTFSDQESRITKPDTSSSVRFMYFNHMNRASKFQPIGSKKNPSVLEAGMALVHAHADFESIAGGQSHEVLVRFSDGWVSARKANFRELFAVNDNKGKSLVEVDNDLQNLISQNFGNVFLES